MVIAITMAAVEVDRFRHQRGEHQELSDLEDDESSQDPTCDLGLNDEALDLGFIVKQYGKQPTIKGADRDMDPKRMLLAVINQLSFESTFSQWGEIVESTKPNYTVYKYYFPKAFRQDEEFLYFQQRFPQRTISKLSEAIWRYVRSNAFKGITCALLVKLFESSGPGRTDQAEQNRVLGEVIIGNASDVLTGDKANVWKQILILPNDARLRTKYPNARFEGEIVVEDVEVETTEDVERDEESTSEVEYVLPECSYTLKKKIVKEVIIIQDAQLAIRAMAKSLELQERILKDALSQRAELHERLKLITGCEELVQSFEFGIPASSNVYELLKDYHKVISSILDNPEEVLFQISKMDDILERYLKLLLCSAENGTQALDEMDIVLDDDSEESGIDDQSTSGDVSFEASNEFQLRPTHVHLSDSTNKVFPSKVPRATENVLEAVPNNTLTVCDGNTTLTSPQTLSGIEMANMADKLEYQDLINNKVATTNSAGGPRGIVENGLQNDEYNLQDAAGNTLSIYSISAKEINKVDGRNLGGIADSGINVESVETPSATKKRKRNGGCMITPKKTAEELPLRQSARLRNTPRKSLFSQEASLPPVTETAKDSDEFQDARENASSDGPTG